MNKNILVSLLVFVPVSLFLLAPASAFDTSWAFFRQVTLTNVEATYHLNEPQEVWLNGTDGHVTNCGNDIRVVDSNGYVIAANITYPSVVGGTYSCLVKFPTNVSASSTATYSIYYGNPAATNSTGITLFWDWMNSTASSVIGQPATDWNSLKDGSGSSISYTSGDSGTGYGTVSGTGAIGLYTNRTGGIFSDGNLTAMMFSTGRPGIGLGGNNITGTGYTMNLRPAASQIGIDIWQNKAGENELATKAITDSTNTWYYGFISRSGSSIMTNGNWTGGVLTATDTNITTGSNLYLVSELAAAERFKMLCFINLTLGCNLYGNAAQISLGPELGNHGVFFTNISQNTPIFETNWTIFGFTANTSDSTVANVSAWLFWNGTNQSYDTYSNDTRQNFTFTKNLTIPLLLGSNNTQVFAYWNYTATWLNGTQTQYTTSPGNTQNLLYAYNGITLSNVAGNYLEGQNISFTASTTNHLSFASLDSIFYLWNSSADMQKTGTSTSYGNFANWFLISTPSGPSGIEYVNSSLNVSYGGQWTLRNGTGSPITVGRIVISNCNATYTQSSMILYNFEEDNQTAFTNAVEGNTTIAVSLDRKSVV